MELRQIRYFVEAARLGHFTRASQKLRVAQPSLSQQIRGLERELGVKLFDRSGRAASLTDAGEVFLVRAERILAETEKAKIEANQFTGVTRGRVVVGALQSLAQVRLPAMLAEFNHSYPGVEIALREDTTHQLLKMLEEGGLDLVFGHTTGVTPSRRIVAETLFDEELLLILSPGHALAERTEVSLREMRDEAFISYKEGSGIRALLVEACRSEGFEPHIPFECDTLRALAAAGLGVAVIPRSMAELPGSDAAALKLRPSLSRHVALFRVENRYLNPAAQTFLQFAKERLAVEDEALEV